MLKITVPAREAWDPVKEEFVYTKETHLQLEHSLVSLAKWESKWNKPFLGKAGEKKENRFTREESIDYIRCMTLTQNVDPNIYAVLPDTTIAEIFKYIESPMTATTFSEDKNSKKSNETITAEIIYYWMISLNVPLECQKWHLNRLLTLIKVCSIKNAPNNKMSKNDILKSNARLNAARRKSRNTRG